MSGDRQSRQQQQEKEIVCSFWAISPKTIEKTSVVSEAVDAVQKLLYGDIEDTLQQSNDLQFRNRVWQSFESALLKSRRPDANLPGAVLCDSDCLLHAKHIENVLFHRYFYENQGMYVERARVLEYSLKVNGYYLLTRFGPDVICALPTSKLAEGTKTSDWRETQMSKLLKDLHRVRTNTGDATQKGMFQCPKCKLYETDYYSLQTRSADEPMTNFVTCFPCNFRFRR